jgi:hypothetical protein
MAALTATSDPQHGGLRAEFVLLCLLIRRDVWCIKRVSASDPQRGGLRADAGGGVERALPGADFTVLKCYLVTVFNRKVRANIRPKPGQGGHRGRVPPHHGGDARATAPRHRPTVSAACARPPAPPHNPPGGGGGQQLPRPRQLPRPALPIMRVLLLYLITARLCSCHGRPRQLTPRPPPRPLRLTSWGRSWR